MCVCVCVCVCVCDHVVNVVNVVQTLHSNFATSLRSPVIQVASGERVWDVINKGEKAKADETKANSRARSARLRVARRREIHK